MKLYLPVMLPLASVLFLLPTATQAAAPQAQTAPTVIIRNFQFSPAEVEVTPGETVSWINQDSVSHTTTADNPSAAESWDSASLSPGQSFAKTFSTPGTYTYHCSIHPMTKGTVRVLAAGAAKTTPQVTPIPGSNLPYDGLPKTGFPALPALGLLGLLPVGLKLARFGRVKSKQTQEESLWHKREFDKS